MCPRPEKTTFTFGADPCRLLLTFFNIVRVCFSTFVLISPGIMHRNSFWWRIQVAKHEKCQIYASCMWEFDVLFVKNDSYHVKYLSLRVKQYFWTTSRSHVIYLNQLINHLMSFSRKSCLKFTAFVHKLTNKTSEGITSDSEHLWWHFHE